MRPASGSTVEDRAVGRQTLLQLGACLTLMFLLPCVALSEDDPPPWKRLGYIMATGDQHDLESYLDKYGLRGISADHLSSCRSRMVRALLEAGLEVTLVSEWNEPPLFLAARCGTPKTLDLLLSWGADINQRDAEGRTALVYFLGLNPKGSPPRGITRRLLERGADPNLAGSDGEPPLVKVFGRPDSADVIADLIRFGADPRVLDFQTASNLETSTEPGETKSRRPHRLRSKPRDLGQFLEVRTPRVSFRFDRPEDFDVDVTRLVRADQRATAEESGQPDPTRLVLAAYRTSQPPYSLLLVERFPGSTTVSQADLESFGVDNLETSAEIIDEQSIPIGRTVVGRSGANELRLYALVPWRPEPLLIVVFGSPEREMDLKPLLRKVVASLEPVSPPALEDEWAIKLAGVDPLVVALWRLVGMFALMAGVATLIAMVSLRRRRERRIRGQL